jgi:hypothetical protein
MGLDVYSGLFTDDLNTVADQLDRPSQPRMRTGCGFFTCGIAGF